MFMYSTRDVYMHCKNSLLLSKTMDFIVVFDYCIKGIYFIYFISVISGYLLLCLYSFAVLRFQATAPLSFLRLVLIL